MLASIKEAPNDKMVKVLQEKLEKLEEDLKFLEEHLKKDLRITRFGNQELVDELEKKEDDKIYAEWLDSQQKQRDMEAQRKLMTEQEGNLDALDSKEALFFEIRAILNQ